MRPTVIVTCEGIRVVADGIDDMRRLSPAELLNFAHHALSCAVEASAIAERERRQTPLPSLFEER